MAAATSPRPAAPSEQVSSRTLHPIYQAIDSHNYSKALKLTSAPPACQWDIVRALRAHALERSGKPREAVTLLWEVLTRNVVSPDALLNGEGAGGARTPREVWSELYDRIECLTDAADAVDGGSENVLEGPPMDAVRRLDVRAFVPIPPPKGGAVNADRATSAAPKAAPAPAGGGKAKGKKGGKGKSKKGSNAAAKTTAKSAPPTAPYPPVTDETVLQTLSVTLRLEGLYDTMSEMFHQAAEALSSPDAAKFDGRTKGAKEREEEHRGILEEGVCVHFRAACDCASVGSVGALEKAASEEGVEDGGNDDGGGEAASRERALQVRLPKLQTLLNATKYYERVQTSSLQLAKLTTQPLHFQWTAISSLWYRESLNELVLMLEKSLSLLSNDNHDGDKAKESKDCEEMVHLQKYLFQMMGASNVSEIESRLHKLKQKLALLPRLAETLSSRVVLRPGDERPVSENDWDVYLETLLVQGKKEEALVALEKIRGTPMNGRDGDGGGNSESGVEDNAAPRIDDEDTIENHAGSLLPYTQRKKLERMAQLSLELGLRDEAEGHYRELLGAFPDQWTYWLGLLDACAKKESSSSPSPASPGNELSEGASMTEEGWKRCRAFAEEVVAAVDGRKYALRGPHLILVELAALKAGTTAAGPELTALCDEICSYGNKFGPLASCCFADLRPYLRTLVKLASSLSGISDSPKEVLTVLQWAKELWTTNYQSNPSASGGSQGGDASADDLRARRKKVRTFIFAVQVVHGIAAESNGSALQLLQTYAPSCSEMVTEWRTSLSFLPGVPPKDGGQKEVLPGDEIALLTSQYLQFRANMEMAKSATEEQPSSYASDSDQTSTPYLLCAAGLLEEAMDQSPYNPNLKIAAVGVYSQLHAARRALAVYQDLGVKQIQLDSCSYLIFPTLVRGGLYTSAIKLSTSLMRLHGSTSKDIKVYAIKSLRNGLMFKAREMAMFQRERMLPSLQLLHSKGLVMDAAALLLPADLGGDLPTDGEAARPPRGGGKPAPPVRLGSEKGFSGICDEDAARVELLAVNAEGHFNAPAVVHAAARSSADSSGDEFVFSDNRDMTVNSFEILHRNPHPTRGEVVAESLRRGHAQGLLARAIAAAAAAAAPKKGKVPRPAEGTTYRCRSLQRCLSRANEFGRAMDMDDVDRALWEACGRLCEVIVVVVHGDGGGEKSPNDDNLAGREKAAVSMIKSTTELVQAARKNDGRPPLTGARACQLLPDRVAPLFVLLETAAGLFSRFGWGKRKRRTKAAAGALADLALSLRDLVSDMLRTMSQYRSFGGGLAGDAGLDLVVEIATGLDVIDTESIQRVVREIMSSRELTKERVDPFLMQMIESLDTFDEE